MSFSAVWCRTRVVLFQPLRANDGKLLTVKVMTQESSWEAHDGGVLLSQVRPSKAAGAATGSLLSAGGRWGPAVAESRCSASFRVVWRRISVGFRLYFHRVRVRCWKGLPSGLRISQSTPSCRTCRCSLCPAPMSATRDRKQRRA